MPKKPTGEALKQRVKKLEKASLGRAQAEEEWGKSEQRYRLLVETMNDGLGVQDEHGVLTYVNDRVCQMLGYSRDDVTGRPVTDFLDDANRKVLKEQMLRRSRGESGSYELVWTAKNGLKIPTIVSAQPILDDDGHYRGSFAVLTDITDRMLAEKKLRESEERFRTQYNNIPIPTYTWQQQGDELFLTDYNDAAESFSKGKIKNFIGQKVSEFYHDQPDVIADLNACYARRKTVRKHMHYRLRSTGEWKYLDVTYVFVPPDLVMVHTEDVTDRKQGEEALREAHEDLEAKIEQRTSELVKANKQLKQEIEERKWIEDALRESETKHRTVLEASPDPVVVYDMDGRVIYVNPAFTQVFGWTWKQLVGKQIDYVPDENWPETQMLIDLVLAGESFTGIQTRRYTKRKDIRDVSISVATYLDRDGNPAGSIHTLRDITERKHLEEQLQQAQKLEAIGTLAGGVAHDFNNLLMGIQGNVSLMLMDVDSTHPYYERLKNIENQVQSGARLTAHLLGYARKGKYEIKPVDLNQLVEMASETFGRTKKEITIHRELAADLLPVDADAAQIEQVLLNLFINAADAMPGGGDIILKTMNITHKQLKGKLYDPKPCSYVLLTVTDTGTGMYKKTMERIFDPFFTTKEMGRGCGLGLASVYGIIKAHGGYIDVDSKRGHGTTFSIYLPQSEKKIHKAVATAGRFEMGTETVLLVDDEEAIRQVGREILEATGYRVLTARNGKEAVEVYRKNRDEIHIVVLDMVMPTMGGGEAYDRMKKINPNVRVLLSSGFSIDGEAAEILERGCDGFIQKPFTIKELSKKMREILNKA
jgi:two-component system cell cycle sensor histidine kinase/response regulator CckA